MLPQPPSEVKSEGMNTREHTDTDSLIQLEYKWISQMTSDSGPVSRQKDTVTVTYSVNPRFKCHTLKIYLYVCVRAENAVCGKFLRSW